VSDVEKKDSTVEDDSGSETLLDHTSVDTRSDKTITITTEALKETADSTSASEGLSATSAFSTDSRVDSSTKGVSGHTHTEGIDEGMASKITCGVFVYRGSIDTLGQRWSSWINRFKFMLIANDMKDDNKNKASLLLMMGPEAYDIYDNQIKKDDDTTETIIRNMTAHFEGDKSEYTQRILFRQTIRYEGESIDDFATRLRMSAKHCKFANVDNEIQQQLVVGSRMPVLQREVLRTKPDLAKTIELARTYMSETADMGLMASAAQQVQAPMGSQYAQQTINFTSEATGSYSSTKTPDRNGQFKRDKCGRCGKERHKQRENCPAIGKTCSKCGKKNHYAAVCQTKDQAIKNKQSQQGHGDGNRKENSKSSRQVTHISQNEDSGSYTLSSEQYADYLRYCKLVESGEFLTVTQAIRQKSGPRVDAIIAGTTVSCLIDTGAPINIIDEETYSGLKHKPRLEKCATKYYGYQSKEPLPIVGQFIENVLYKGKASRAGFLVTKGSAEKLLSGATAEAVGAIIICNSLSEQSSSRSKTSTNGAMHRLSVDQLKTKYPNAFSGKLGCIKGHQVKLDLDLSVKPVKQKLRPIAFHLRDPVSQELDQQEAEGIIEKVDSSMGPTTWISNLVVIPKDRNPTGSLSCLNEKAKQIEVRLTCDSRALNKAIRRTRFPTKTLEDIVYMVNGATVFSKLDIRKAFHQLELSEESRGHTTIVTHKGLYRYKRLHMGISCASEIFTETVRVILQNCSNQLNMTDDILVFGKNEEEHNKALHRVLSELEANGITLNADKCELYKDELVFFGIRFSKDGIAPTQNRCKALRETKAPKNVKELKSFLCTAQYSNRWINDMSTIAEPLWYLTKAQVKWKWTEVEQNAFEKIKDAISTKCLAYFNKEWLTEVIVDASPVGLAAVLVQINTVNLKDRRVVYFASRLLTDVERRYSQCEKEALAAVWGCERFWLYLFGNHFTLVTDNKAVNLIFGNGLTRPPARIERWALRLTQFDFTVQHRAGTTNIADYLSRNPDRTVSLDTLIEQQLAERYINSIVMHATPSAITRNEIVQATALDKQLQELAKWTKRRDRHKLPILLKEYRHIIDEISQSNCQFLLNN
jgi:hypothetical protein